ncbi:MAG: hypothetical protein JJE47_11270 [Acidimicrobiia bacterium]|nr:hypothetical protein [Acidimicrobiia bacterium]
MPSPDDAFDAPVATSVVCSVAAPIDGLRELGRILLTTGFSLVVTAIDFYPQNWAWFCGRQHCGGFALLGTVAWLVALGAANAVAFSRIARPQKG